MDPMDSSHGKVYLSITVIGTVSCLYCIKEDLVEVKVFSMGASSNEVIVKSDDGFISESREERGDEGKKGQGKNKLALVQTRSKGI